MSMAQMDLSWTDKAWRSMEKKLEATRRRIGASFPYAAVDGVYTSEPDDWWTNGFWPGLLWLFYRESGDNQLKTIAAKCEEKLDRPLQAYTPLHNDVGFMWSLSSVANYKLTGNDTSRIRALTAASHLMGRYNAQGKFIRAWNGDHQTGWAIIDCLMNLPLLYWASEATQDPRFRHVAVQHTDTVLREFVRPDGSVHHIVIFDPETGVRTGEDGGQGYAPDSAWSRGTAWAIYGFALGYRYTSNPAYRLAAHKTAAYFLDHLPDDKVPPYDFRAPSEQHDVKDGTAAACAACGLLELAALEQDEARASHFNHAGAAILKSLYENFCTFESPGQESFLSSGTANFPRKAYVNTPLIYGDYFFAEGVAKLRGYSATFW